MTEQEQELITNWDNWKDLEPNSFIYQVQKGRDGFNTGLENGLVTLNKYIYGTQRGRYYLIGGDSGTGKTTITDFMFILNSWESAKLRDIPIRIFYCSFEISRLEKEAKWVSYYIYLREGKCIPSDYILGRIPGRLLSEEDQEIVKKAYHCVKVIMQDIIFMEDAVHPTAIFESIIQNHYENYGIVKRSPVAEADKKKGKKGRILGYVPKEPDMYTILVVDHLALLQSEMGLNLKGTMDKMSRYAVILRNMFQCTCVFIQQFSADMLQHKRTSMRYLAGTKKESAIVPSRLDFGDSKATFRDCDIALGIVKPFQFELESYCDINTSKISLGGLGDFMVLMTLMKNRYGTTNRNIPMYFNPIAGIVEELPSLKLDPNAADPWYDKATHLDKICQLYFPQS